MRDDRCMKGCVCACVSFLHTKSLHIQFPVNANISFSIFDADVLASQDQSGGDATVTIDQREFPQ